MRRKRATTVRGAKAKLYSIGNLIMRRLDRDLLELRKAITESTVPEIISRHAELDDAIELLLQEGLTSYGHGACPVDPSEKPWARFDARMNARKKK